MFPISALFFSPSHLRPLSKPFSPHLRRFLSIQSPPPPLLEYTLSHPIYTIWGANTGVGKTLLSSGLAASLLSPLSDSSNPMRKFIYIKPVQTGFPSDSDSHFVYTKFSEIFLHRHPHSSVFASNHTLRTSMAAAKAVPGSGVAVQTEESGKSGAEFRDLGWYEERKLQGEGEDATVFELICKTLYGFREAVSPHLAAEREGAIVKDSVLSEILKQCLGIGVRDGVIKNQNLGVLTVVETAGGVASPGPSGSLQCDLYRYLFTLCAVYYVVFTLREQLLVIVSHPCA